MSTAIVVVAAAVYSISMLGCVVIRQIRPWGWAVVYLSGITAMTGELAKHEYGWALLWCGNLLLTTWNVWIWLRIDDRRSVRGNRRD